MYLQKFKFQLKQFLILVFLFACSLVYGQYKLPVTMDFDSCGFNGVLNASACFSNCSGYYFSGATPKAAKFSHSGDFIDIPFTCSAKNVSYSLAGFSYTGGFFLLLESADGHNWDTVRCFTNLKASYSVFLDSISSGSRFLRFVYSQKVRGNVGLDFIEIFPRGVCSTDLIAVYQNQKHVLPNELLFIGNQREVFLNIKNNSKRDLDQLHVVIMGNDSLDFTVDSFPDSFPMDTDQKFNLKYNPKGDSGSCFIRLIICQGEDHEKLFEMGIKAIRGLKDSSPVGQPVKFKFNSVTPYSFEASFIKSDNPAENYLVLIRKNMEAEGFPEDNKSYSIGDYIGASKVCYLGSDSQFNYRFDSANTKYYFSVFAYNGALGYENYLETNPLRAEITSLGSQIGNYYTGINAQSKSLINDLGVRLKSGFKKVNYDQYASVMMDNFFSEDTLEGLKKVTCFYSGVDYLYDSVFSWGIMSREHSFPRSWMPVSDENEACFSDLHSIFPVYQEQINALRLNYPFGEVTSVLNEFGKAKLGLDNSGKIVFEPASDHKGDIARALFYMCIRYGGIGDRGWDLPPNLTMPYVIQNQEILKKWHFEDLPDAHEIARHEYVYAVQGNRNPFIDSVNFACVIDFDELRSVNSSEVDFCSDFVDAISITKNEKVSVELLNLNSKSGVQIVINRSEPGFGFYSLIDISGRILIESRLNDDKGVNIINFDEYNLKSGIYFFTLKTKHVYYVKKLILN